MLENFKKYNFFSTISRYIKDDAISTFKKVKLSIFLILDLFIVFPFIFTIATGNLGKVLSPYDYTADAFFIAGMIWTFIYLIIFEQSIGKLFNYNNLAKKQEKGASE